MAITLHHGANGSYKSSGVVQDYIVPAATEPTGDFPRGRPVVTNLRGMSTERFYKVFGDDNILEDFEIIYVDTGTREGRQRLLTFWHWVPLGALLVFDECNEVFPKTLKDGDFAKLNYKTLEEAEAENRPHEWLTAWTKHRHSNWDIVLMCPNIKSCRADIRETTEGAYKHVNMALIGIKGRYKEGFHEADNNGNSSNITISKIKKIKSATFALYDSTKTGKHKDTHNGVSILQSPRLLLALGILALCGVMLVRSGGINPFPDAAPAGPGQVDSLGYLESVPADIQPGVSSPAAPGVRTADRLVARPRDNGDVSHPLQGMTFAIASRSRFGNEYVYLMRAESPAYQTLVFTSRDLKGMGYIVRDRTDCELQLTYDRWTKTINCRPALVRTDDARAGQQSATSGVLGARKD